jgi:subtilisin
MPTGQSEAAGTQMIRSGQTDRQPEVDREMREFRRLEGRLAAAPPVELQTLRNDFRQFAELGPASSASDPEHDALVHLLEEEMRAAGVPTAGEHAAEERPGRSAKSHPASAEASMAYPMRSEQDLEAQLNELKRRIDEFERSGVRESSIGVPGAQRPSEPEARIAELERQLERLRGGVTPQSAAPLPAGGSVEAKLAELERRLAEMGRTGGAVSPMDVGAPSRPAEDLQRRYAELRASPPSPGSVRPMETGAPMGSSEDLQRRYAELRAAARSTGSVRPMDTGGGGTVSVGSAGPFAPSVAAPGSPAPTGPRPVRVLIGKRAATAQSSDPVDLTILTSLKQDLLNPNKEEFRGFRVKDLDPTPAAFAVEGVPALETLKVEIDGSFEEFRAKVDDNTQGKAVAEIDQDLDILAAPATAPPEQIWGPLMPLAGGASEFRVTVRGDSPTGPPVAGATVYLMGSMFPAQATTNESGVASLFLSGERPDTLRSIYVKPRDAYWSLWLERPALMDGGRDNVVVVKRLDESYVGSQGDVYGWGQRAMNLDQVITRYRGSGVKIGIIDSGLDTSHPDLQAIRAAGRDLVEGGQAAGWTNDVVGHGTHVAGVIAASANAAGIRGFAPDAEVLVFRVFPGGKMSSLIDALQGCIDQKVDVVNLSLGMAQSSELLQQKIAAARDAGVACIAAAGNSGTNVQYPAAYEEVLAVAAIGEQGKFLPDSYHSQQIGTADGRFFSARFTCFGREIGVCAPGVAIVSSVPNRNYAAWDGTSMACPHVVGLAALIVEANRQTWGNLPGREKVRRLFERLTSSATSLNLDRTLQGAGLPDAVRALGVQPSPGANPSPGTQPNSPASQLSDGNDLRQIAGLLGPVVKYIEQRTGANL